MIGLFTNINSIILVLIALLSINKFSPSFKLSDLSTAFLHKMVINLFLFGFLLLILNFTLLSNINLALALSCLVVLIPLQLNVYKLEIRNLNPSKLYKKKIIQNLEAKTDTDDSLNDTLQTINTWFLNSKCYLKRNYSISCLERDINVDRKIISRAINLVENENFYTFIARHRINYAKEIIASNKLFTLESLSNDSGFNSKSSFNKYFKIFVGCTPSNYNYYEKC